MKLFHMKFFVFIFFIFILSCKDTSENKTKHYSMKMSNTIIEDNHIIRERHYVYWKPNSTSKTTYYCSINFNGKNAQFWFDRKCPYYFETIKTGYRTFDMYWSLKMKERCKSDLYFLEQSNGINSFPKEGDFFAKYTIVNDSLISVDYKYKDWIQKVNSLAKDSLFPKYLYFHKSN